MENQPPINKEATQHEPIVSETLKEGVRKNREQIADARAHEPEQSKRRADDDSASTQAGGA